LRLGQHLLEMVIAREWVVQHRLEDRYRVGRLAGVD
jgi:hypothetical protein